MHHRSMTRLITSGMSSSYRLGAPLRHESSDSMVRRRRRCAQTLNDTIDVGRGTILAHLPLALEPSDRELHGDNRLHLLRDVFLGRVGHLPGARAVSLVMRCERFEMPAEEPRFVADAQGAVCVHGNVIPGRYDSRGL